MDKFDQRKAELEAGYANDPFQRKEVTAESIVEDHERPMRTLGNMMLLGGKLKLAGTMAPILETARLRGQGIVPVNYKSVIDDAFMIPRNTSSKFIHKDSDISVTKGGLLDPNRVNPTEMYSTGTTPDDPYQNVRSIKRAWNAQLTQGGKSRRFNLKAFLNNNMEDYKRLVAGDWSTNWASGLPVGKSKDNLTRDTAFKKLRKEKMDIFMDDYGDALKKHQIPQRKINLDHQLTLVQSVGIYHNTERGSSLFNRIQDIALYRGYTPGDAEANLDLADPESHRVKTNFFNDLHGLSSHNNMKYWNGQHRDTGKTRFQIMSESHKGKLQEDLHIEVVSDYFDLVDRGTVILNDAKQIWKAENLKDIMPEQVTDELMKVIVDPDFKQYSPESLKPVIDAIIQQEASNIKNLERVLEIEGQLEKLDMLTSAETILPADSALVKELKGELKKLKSPSKSKWFMKDYKKIMEEDQQGLDLFGYNEIIERDYGPD